MYGQICLFVYLSNNAWSAWMNGWRENNNYGYFLSTHLTKGIGGWSSDVTVVESCPLLLSMTSIFFFVSGM